MLHKTVFKAGLIIVFWIVGNSMGLENLGLLGRLEFLLGLIKGRRSERRRTTCPTCTGTGICTTCNGKGCARCNGDGRCAQCNGLGNLITGSGNVDANR
jgi:hypothetical protein